MESSTLIRYRRNRWCLKKNYEVLNNEIKQCRVHKCDKLDVYDIRDCKSTFKSAKIDQKIFSYLSKIGPMLSWNAISSPSIWNEGNVSINISESRKRITRYVCSYGLQWILWIIWLTEYSIDWKIYSTITHEVIHWSSSSIFCHREACMKWRQASRRLWKVRWRLTLGRRDPTDPNFWATTIFGVGTPIREPRLYETHIYLSRYRPENLIRYIQSQDVQL